jgi:phage I-like protein
MQDKTDDLKRMEPSGLDEFALEASSLGTSEAPARVLIAPWGQVESSSGSFLVDEESARETIAAFTGHRTDLPVDYEHQTLGGAYSSPSGQAPAAGWIKTLSLVSPEEAEGDAEAEAGLWAEVEWTEEARKRLQQRQYRYLSPVALVRRSDRRLVGLHSVALTNKPAIVGMRPVVSTDPPVNDAALDVASVASELRGRLSLDESSDDGVVLVAAAERIRSLEAQEQARAAEERVSRAMSAGKLTAAQRDWAISLAQRSPDEFEAWERHAPVVVPLGRLQPPQGSEHLCASDRKRGIESAARAEWRVSRGVLEKLCSEEAYVARAVRESGLSV